MTTGKVGSSPSFGEQETAQIEQPAQFGLHVPVPYSVRDGLIVATALVHGMVGQYRVMVTMASGNIDVELTCSRSVPVVNAQRLEFNFLFIYFHTSGYIVL